MQNAKCKFNLTTANSTSTTTATYTFSTVIFFFGKVHVRMHNDINKLKNAYNMRFVILFIIKKEYNRNRNTTVTARAICKIG